MLFPIYVARNSLCDVLIHTRPALDWLACGFSIAYIFIHADVASTLTQHHDVVAASKVNGAGEDEPLLGGRIGGPKGAPKCSKCLNKHTPCDGRLGEAADPRRETS